MKLAQGLDRPAETAKVSTYSKEDLKEITAGYIRSRKYWEGIQFFNKELASQNEKNLSLLLARGQIYFACSAYRKALKDFNAAVSLDKDSSEAWLRIAIAQCRKSDMVAASSTFKHLAEIIPKERADSEIAALTARGFLELGMTEAAKHFLSQLLSEERTNSNLDPSSEAGTTTSAPSERTTASKDSTAKILQSGTNEAVSSNPELLYLYAQSLASSNEGNKALELLNKALSKNSNSFECLIARAKIYLQLGKSQEAKEDAQKALELNSRSAMANYYLAQALFNLDDIAEARKAINECIRLAGNKIFFEALALSAQIALKQGDLARSATDGAASLKLSLNGRGLGPLPDRKVTVPDLVAGQMPSSVMTPHFTLYGDIEESRLNYYAEISEAFINFADRNLIKVKGNFPRSIFIFRDKPTSRAFLQQKLGFYNKVQGVYLAGPNAVVTFDGVGIEILFHELMHTVLGEYKQLDFWAEEGIPTIFDQLWGYPKSTEESNSLFLILGLPEVWVPKYMGGKERVSLHLKDIVTDAKHANAEHEYEQRQVALFLIKHGKLKQFLKLVEANNKKGYNYFIEAVFEKRLDNLSVSFSQYMKELSSKTDKLKALPASQFFANKSEFEKFYSSSSSTASLFGTSFGP
ncbi:MAG: tetratricopeptide repeat protein [Candidatus Obscuribacterales bacterium]|nr:tetratricopeptide repeat protein [Candidatus Obscuribacterales bacterium]